MAKKRANGEGSIRKRKDGRWEGRYTAGHDPNTGKTIHKNVLGKTQGEVKEYSIKGIALKRAKYSPPPDGEGVLHLVVGNCINKTKYIKLKGHRACGLIKESLSAQ